MVQLGDVARPGVGAHRVEGGAGESGDLLPVVAGVVEEVAGEEGDVRAPLAQRRQRDLDRLQPEEEVFAEAPFGHRAGGRCWSPTAPVRPPAGCARSPPVRTRRSPASAGAWPAPCWSKDRRGRLGSRMERSAAGEAASRGSPAGPSACRCRERRAERLAQGGADRRSTVSLITKHFG